MKKPPCVDCKRHKYYGYDYSYDRLTSHYCISNRRSRIMGSNIEYACWWYRCTPFCKFEPKA